jgi:PKD repeat protein
MSLIKKAAFLSFILILCLYSSGIGIVQGAENSQCFITIYRVQMIDPIESFLEGEADWYYKVTITDSTGTTEVVFDDDSTENDWVFNNNHIFSVESLYVTIRIYLYEGDPFGDETADISGSSSRTYYNGYYDLRTNSLTGDEIQQDGINYKTSGDFDGSTGTDQNDANLWFRISDDYELPVANAGTDRNISSGVKINFDASGSTASSGSEIETYQWDFENDGIFDAEGIQTSFTYSGQGSYTVLLRVTDNYGQTDTDTCTIVVNNPPVASFTYSPTEPEIVDVIEFVDTSTDDDGTLLSWYWNFGDGTTSYETNPTHQYSQTGTYQVSLTVTDNNGADDTTTISIDVTDNYRPPIANAGMDKIINSGEKINFDAHLSSACSVSEIVTYQWDFENDGIFDAQGVQTSFTYSEKGVYTVLLKVTDNYGETDTDTCIINVTNSLPSSSFTLSPTTPTILDTISFSETCSDSDGSLVSWYWDFDDGTTSTERNPSHQYSRKGTYHVSLKATDNDNDWKITTIPVTVLNIQPTAVFTASSSTPIIGDTVDFSDNSTDPEEAITERFWDFGDGSFSTTKNPSHMFETTGDYQVTLTVTDDEGETDTTSIMVHVSEPSILQEYQVPIIIVAAVAIAAVILFFVLRRNKT